ncbi:MAG: hypothetical protein IJK92_08555 [Bacteroidales bacterium]|nr:hypothetical protein [Bacteroidales bacterium]
MKKLFIAASLIIGMIAGAMVLSSFSEPKEELNEDCIEITMADDWTYVGDYVGRTSDDKTQRFRIWEKEGMCNSYYWVSKCDNSRLNPDITSCTKGVLRQNRDGYWYAAFCGDNYFIDF